MSLAQSAFIIVLMLLMVNGAMGGAVSDAVVDFLTSPEKEAMRDSFQCTTGLIVYKPVKDVYGFAIPIPTFGDIMATSVIAGAVLFAAHLVKASPTWKGAILLFIAIWITLKLVGWIMIVTSGEGCMAAMGETSDMLSGTYTVTSLLGAGALYKIVKAAKR